MKTIFVSGDAAKPNRFEFSDQSISGADVIALSSPNAGVTHAAISQVREGSGSSDYLPLSEFNQMQLDHGDIVSFRSDVNETNISINVDGTFNGASAVTVSKHATLKQVLDLVEVDPQLSAFDRIFIKRKSIAGRQKQSASSSTDSESRIRAQEAELISEFVKRVSLVEPQGTLVVVSKSGMADIMLENDDTIFIPRRNPSVLVSGEVRLPRAFLWEKGTSAVEYISQAGGFSNNANSENVLVVKQDGRVIDARGVRIEEGDELLVLPKAPTKNLQLAASITDILYKIAVATSVALSIK